MSNRSQWKMLHLLYTLPPSDKKGLSISELVHAGVDCDSDTYQPLISSGAVTQNGTNFVLSNTSSAILGSCLVANRRWASKDIWVDYPQAFVIMPFSEGWSQNVYDNLIKPAVEGSEIKCVRGDSSLRIGDLSQNIWNEILQAGVIIADVSALNANVFYEVGLAHALGKEVFILKEKNANVPADFGGSHYYEYDLTNLSFACDKLKNDLLSFSVENNFKEVKAIRNRETMK